jgi:hypothetical protein
MLLAILAVRRTQPFMKFLKQRARSLGRHLLHAKVRLLIGLWVAGVAAVERMTREVTVVEAEVLL